MSEAEKIDRATRRTQAEARLARSRPAREAAAAAHAADMGSRMRLASGETAYVAADRSRTPELSRLERKVLDAASDILASRGAEGERLAEAIHNLVGTRTEY